MRGVIDNGCRIDRLGAMVSFPQALLLDLDDTILDDTSDVVSCWREACLTYRADMGDLDPDVVFEAIDRVRDWYWSDPERHRIGRLDLAAARREVVQLALADVGVDDPDLATQIGHRYHLLRHHRLRPIDDAVATVRWLRDRGCRLALLTNGGADAQREKINRFGLAELFEVILIEGEVGFGKPDPRIYVRALEALGVAPVHAWMVGDNLEWDVAGPQRHGISGIWIDVHGTGLPRERSVTPDRIIRRLSDLRNGGVSESPPIQGVP